MVTTTVTGEARAAARAGEDAELASFVHEHYDRLLRLARLICRDTSDAADAVQAALEQAWRFRGSLREGERRRAWLDRIVAREAVRIAKARSSRLARLLSPTTTVRWTEPVAGEPEAATLLALRAAFERLSAEQRAVVGLHLYAGYSVAETAELVGAPLETVRSRLRLAKDRLRRELEESGR